MKATTHILILTTRLSIAEEIRLKTKWQFFRQKKKHAHGKTRNNSLNRINNHKY